ncbi:Fe-S cluster assembly protein SufD [Lichenicoccus sp.]|uniref:Fe-S cluster assembly protein SufD n=1 Tax=Lichenicoccus sp. TaxID=2781899 RepID=UPI003D0B82C1
MNAQAFLDLYEDGKQSLPGAVQARDLAAALLRTSGLPTRRMEQWKYTDLRLLTALTLGDAPDTVDAAMLLDNLGLAEAGLADTSRLVFVNGRFESSLSRLDEGLDIEIGVSMGPLARPERDGMVALNTMLTKDGARIHVGPGIDAGRVLLVCLGRNDAEPAVLTQPRFAVLLEEGARLSLLEIAHGDGLYVNNPVLEIELRARAHLAHVLLQDEGARALHFSTVYTSVDTAASYDSFTLALGARLARHEVHARLAGRGGTVHVNGAQLLGDRQHADLTSVIAHDAPGCISRQTVKNVLSGHARGVFQGKIVVDRIAQKTDGYQMNQALLLSETAEIDSKPELEIYADDVKCSHGATAGALDEEQLFYLRSRGVPADTARAILVRAFLDDALALIEDAPVRALLDAALDRSWSGSTP